jgi:hypothetical protein
VVTDVIPGFALARPFEPFSLFLADGREVQVYYPDGIAVGRHVLTVYVFHASRQIEVIDVEHIVAIKTLRGVNPSAFIR